MTSYLYDLGIVVTGSRDLHDYEWVKSILCTVILDYNLPKRVCLYEGEAAGLDLTAKRAGYIMEWKIEPFAADWKKHGKKAGLLRNIEMVDALIANEEIEKKVCVGFPLPQSRGTVHCLKYAKERGLDVLVTDYPHPGFISWEDFERKFSQ